MSNFFSTNHSRFSIKEGCKLFVLLILIILFYKFRNTTTTEHQQQQDIKMPANYIESEAVLKEGLTLFTAPSPNGRKIPIYLELLGVNYDVRAIDFSKQEQKSDWFKKYNPNGKIPVLLVVDKLGEVTEAIPESGAILQYISEQLDTKGQFSYKLGDKNHYKEVEWAYFHLSTFSPTAFESLFFNHLSPEKDAFGIKRFTDETNRVVDIVEKQLATEGTGYIVGPHISTVDILFFPWIKMLGSIEVSLDNRPNLKAWFEKLSAIEAFKVGASVPA